MNETLVRIGEIGLVPVIKIDDAEKAQPLAEALIAGDVPCAEITFRTAQGEEAIRRMVKAFPNMLVGAGTVLTTGQADRAKDAGARFIVSPGLNPRVVEHCLKLGLPVTPGCATPSDIERALELGLDAVKFFPAEQAGGLPYINAVAAPYAGMKFMPTGGISLENLGRYIAHKAVLACGGSYMVTAELLGGGKWQQITELCRASAEIIRKTREERK